MFCINSICHIGSINPSARKTPDESVGGSPSLPSAGGTTTTSISTMRTQAIIGTDHGGTTSTLRLAPSMNCIPRTSPQGYTLHLTRDLKPLERLDRPIGTHFNKRRVQQISSLTPREARVRVRHRLSYFPLRALPVLTPSPCATVSVASLL